MAQPLLFDLRGKRVYVAGHNGMAGSAVVRRLAGEGCEILTATRQALNVLIHSATRQGGLYDQEGLAVAAHKGKPLTAAQAKDAGLIDAVVGGDLVEAAVAYARDLVAKGAGPRRTRERSVAGGEKVAEVIAARRAQAALVLMLVIASSLSQRATRSSRRSALAARAWRGRISCTEPSGPGGAHHDAARPGPRR